MIIPSEWWCRYQLMYSMIHASIRMFFHCVHYWLEWLVWSEVEFTAANYSKAVYGQYIMYSHGYLGRGNRRVTWSCVVWNDSYPAPDNNYILSFQWSLVAKCFNYYSTHLNQYLLLVTIVLVSGGRVCTIIQWLLYG